MVKIELTEEMQRDPGRFVKHLDTRGIYTKAQFDEELKRSLPDQTKWSHPIAKRKITADWSKSKQRVIDRSDALYDTEDIQETVAVNQRDFILKASSIEDIVELAKEIPRNERIPSFRKDAQFRIKNLIKKGILPEGTVLPRL